MASEACASSIKGLCLIKNHKKKYDINDFLIVIKANLKHSKLLNSIAGPVLSSVCVVSLNWSVFQSASRAQSVLGLHIDSFEVNSGFLGD